MRWAVGEAHPLPFRTAAFDALFAGELVEHLADPGAGVAEFRRVLRPGGTLILTTPNRLRLANLVDRSERPYSPDHLSELSYDEAHALLAREGFDIVASTGVHLELLLNWLSPMPKLDRLQRRLESTVGGAPDARPPRRGRPGPAVFARPHLRRAPARVTFLAGGGERRAAVAGCVAAAAWIALCARWFDGPHRGATLLRIPPAVFALVAPRRRARVDRRPARPASGDGGDELAREAGARGRPRLRVPPAPGLARGAGYVTADGALSGIVALRIREGLEHLVFVPHVPYSGSLKSHLAAALGLVVDLPRAFALVSVLFYCVFVAAAFLLAERAWRRSDLALAAGVYLAFAPAFVTRYSLSNDGNYVEVLALGSAALLALVAWDEDRARLTLPWIAGLLLGLAFWCHILAVIPAAAAVLFLLGAPACRGAGAARGSRADSSSATRPASCGTPPTAGNRSATCSREGRRWRARSRRLSTSGRGRC